MKDIILLLGKQDDPHIRGIMKELRSMGENVVLLDKLGHNDSFEVKVDRASKSVIHKGNCQIESDDIKTVWNYGPLQIVSAKHLVRTARKFALSEWSAGISSLWRTISAKWVNAPNAAEVASNRLGQLEVARKMGLSVPKTLITNDPRSFKEFFSECHANVIAKTLNSSIGLPEGKMIFTTRMTKQDVERSGALRLAPCMFQEYVPKKTEFRVTMIGETIYSVEIFSQNSSKTKDDWRRYDDFSKTPYVPSKLPDDVVRKLLKTKTALGLEYGAADLIKTTTDEFVFLEINPNGRWWWIEELTGLPITKGIAHYLALN